MQIYNIDFYDKYFELPNSLFSAGNNQRQEYKNHYIYNKTTDNYIYKFVLFDENLDLNRIKLKMIYDKQLWVSNHTYFDDKTETDIRYNIDKISRKAGYTEESINNIMRMSKEMNDVSCFTYEISNRMWKDYANDYNGVCLRFLLIDTNKFFPVVYLNKNIIDFTDWFIGAYKNLGNRESFNYIDRLSILPWVMKYKSFSWENELRFLCGDVYDSEDDVMGGRIFAGKKELMNYKGTVYKYDDCGIQLENIIIGDNCSDDHKNELDNIIKEFNYA